MDSSDVYSSIMYSITCVRGAQDESALSSPCLSEKVTVGETSTDQVVCWIPYLFGAGSTKSFKEKQNILHALIPCCPTMSPSARNSVIKSHVCDAKFMGRHT